MIQADIFKDQKTHIYNLFERLKVVLQRLHAIDVDTASQLDKVSKAIQSLSDDVLRIALIGAYSDGKTSVVAGWLGQLMSDMKINTEESSDQIAIYRPDCLDGDYEIVDTPGLFGEKVLCELDKSVHFEDITKQYLSEAHLIFYVVDAANPLKDSHRDSVKWILRDLNKLSSTIFIINKMDEVVDLRDSLQFDEMSLIKTKNIIEKLCRFVDLSEDEANSLSIICLSSDPNGKGLSFWFNKKDIYEERSRINLLRDKSLQIIKSTARTVLIRKTGFDVICDVVGVTMKAVADLVVILNLHVDNLESSIIRIRDEFLQGKKEIADLKSDLTSQLVLKERSLLSEISTLSNDGIQAFVDDKLGDSDGQLGYKLFLDIQNCCDHYFGRVRRILEEVQGGIESNLLVFSDFENSISKFALNSSSKIFESVAKTPVATLKNGVFLIRDVVAKITGTVYKFKPWQAANIAAKLSKWAGPVGGAIKVFSDLLSLSQQRKAEEQLLEVKGQLSDFVKQAFKAVYDILLDDSKLITEFAPQLKVFEDLLDEQLAHLEDLKSRRVILDEVETEFKAILCDGNRVVGY